MVKIRKPLDFTAVTDHSELLGEMYSIMTPGVKGHNKFVPKFLRSIYHTDSELGLDTSKQRKIFNMILKRAGHPTASIRVFSEATRRPRVRGTSSYRRQKSITCRGNSPRLPAMSGR